MSLRARTPMACLAGVASLACLACLSCGEARREPRPAGAATAAAAAPDAAAAAIVFAPARPVLDGLPAAAFLPADARLVAAVASPRRVFEALDLGAVFGRYRPSLAARPLLGEVSLASLDAAGLEAIGIDADRPAGVAWLDAEGETWAIFAATSAPERLVSALGATAPERAGDATLYAVAAPGTRLVIRAGQAFVVRDVAAARRIARAGGAALEVAPAYREAVAGLGFGGLAGAWLHPSVLGRALPAPQAPRDPARPPEASAAPAAAPDPLLGLVAGVAVGLDLEGPVVLVRARVALAAGGASPLGARPATLDAVIGWLGTPPEQALALIVTPERTLEAAEALAGLGEVPRLAERIGQAGLDPARDVLPVLSGEIGVVHGGRRPHGRGVVLGLTDPAKLREALDRRPSDAPGRDRLAVIGDRLVVARDPGLVERVAQGRPRPAWPPLRRALLGAEPALARYVGWPLGARPPRLGALVGLDGFLGIGLATSKELEMKREELAALGRELDELGGRLEAARDRALDEAARSLGPLVLSAREAQGALTIEGGFALGEGSVRAWASRAAASILEASGTPDELRRVAELEGRRQALRGAIDRLERKALDGLFGAGGLGAGAGGLGAFGGLGGSLADDTFGGLLGEGPGGGWAGLGGLGTRGAGGGGGGTAGIGSLGGGAVGSGGGYGRGGGGGYGTIGHGATRPRPRATLAPGGDPALRAHVERKLPRVTYCYARRLEEEPALAGALQVDVAAGTDGAVRASDARGAGEGTLRACVTAALGGRLATPPEEPLRGTFSIQLDPGR